MGADFGQDVVAGEYDGVGVGVRSGVRAIARPGMQDGADFVRRMAGGVHIGEVALGLAGRDVMLDAVGAAGRHIAIALVGIGGAEPVGAGGIPHCRFDGRGRGELQVARVKGQQGLVDVVGPERGAGGFNDAGDAAVVVGVAVGDDDARDVGGGAPEQGHAGLEQVKGGVGAGVNQGQAVVLKDVGPGGAGVRVAFLRHGHGVDAAALRVGEAQHHTVAGGIAVTQHLNIGKEIGHRELPPHAAGPAKRPVSRGYYNRPECPVPAPAGIPAPVKPDAG